jgi:hypothetical protein
LTEDFSKISLLLERVKLPRVEEVERYQ